MSLDSAELAAMRADLEAETLPDLANLLTVAYTPDGQGGLVEAWGTATANVACRLDPLTGREALAAGATQPLQSMMLTVPYSAALTTEMRVATGGNTYNVISVSAGSWQTCKRAVVEKV